MAKRVKVESEYNNYNVNPDTVEKIKPYKGVENVVPCYGCEQGFGNDDTGLWKEVDDKIFQHVFPNGLDFTVNEIHDLIYSHRLQNSSEEDIMVRPFTRDDIKLHLNKHSSNEYWKLRKSLDTTSALIDAIALDEDGNVKVLSKEERDTYHKLTDTLMKTLDKIEQVKKKRADENSKKV